MKAVIMAGGSGIRFWPRSIETKPKQFLPLSSEQTMIQETYLRFKQWLPDENIYVVTTEKYVSLVLEQLPELSAERIILEPHQRDTGPCIALTALHFMEKGDDEVLVTAPSDQFIPDWVSLMNALALAEKIAITPGSIVTLGIIPTRPEPGYGYVETEVSPCRNRVYQVRSFMEKPSIEKAKELIKRSNIYWNSGIFVWRPSTIAHYMTIHQPEIWTALKENINQLDQVYSNLPKISVDYAILEKADRIYSIPVSFEWDDVGSWTALERIYTIDSKGNLTVGDIQTLSVTNSIIFSDRQKAIVLGVEDMIIVSTDDGLLICHKSQEQNIKKLLSAIKPLI